VRKCKDCDVEIPAIRLKAKPNATLCVNCQAKVDTVICAPATDMGRLGFAKTHSDDPKIPKYVTYGLASLFESEDYKTGTAKNTMLYTVSNAGRQGWADEMKRRAA